MAQRKRYLSPEPFNENNEKQFEKDLEEIKQGIFSLLNQYCELTKRFERLRDNNGAHNHS